MSEATKGTANDKKKKKEMAPRSKVWNHFTKVIEGDAVTRATCNYCKNEFACATKKNGTSSLLKHLTTCKRNPNRVNDDKQSTLQATPNQADNGLLLEIVYAEASRLQAENARVEAQIGAYTAELATVDDENAVLRTRHGELAGRLQALDGILEIFQVTGAPVDIPEIPDPLLRPWQSPFAPQLAAGGGMLDVFRF